MNCRQILTALAAVTALALSAVSHAGPVWADKFDAGDAGFQSTLPTLTAGVQYTVTYDLAASQRVRPKPAPRPSAPRR